MIGALKSKGTKSWNNLIWLVIWNMMFIFPYLRNFIVPTDSYVQRGWFSSCWKLPLGRGYTVASGGSGGSGEQRLVYTHPQYVFDIYIYTYYICYLWQWDKARFNHLLVRIHHWLYYTLIRDVHRQTDCRLICFWQPYLFVQTPGYSAIYIESTIVVLMIVEQTHSHLLFFENEWGSSGARSMCRYLSYILEILGGYTDIRVFCLHQAPFFQQTFPRFLRRSLWKERLHFASGARGSAGRCHLHRDGNGLFAADWCLCPGLVPNLKISHGIWVKHVFQGGAPELLNVFFLYMGALWI